MNGHAKRHRELRGERNIWPAQDDALMAAVIEGTQLAAQNMSETHRTLFVGPDWATESEASQHHVGVDLAQPRMLESLGQTPGNRKSHALPQSHRALIRGDDEIELHGIEPAGPGFGE